MAEFLSMLRNCSSLLRAEASQIASRAFLTFQKNVVLKNTNVY
ncbi:MAG TPA: hypothetical protein VI894_01765 [Candidatus Nanoarchaeia archaeon]|nr:hypothetical protein [Candidatus Nanoarchaeia archaeon]